MGNRPKKYTRSFLTKSTREGVLCGHLVGWATLQAVEGGITMLHCVHNI